MIATAFLGLVLLIVFLWWLWNENSNKYFKKLNVPYLPAPMLGGHLKEMILQRKAMTDVIMDIYNDPKTKAAPAVGVRFLHKHGLVIKDLELLKRILIKDFNNFQDRRTNSDIRYDFVGGANIFMLKNVDEAWKNVRAKITPVFTGTKMKQLFQLVDGVGRDLTEYLDRTIPTETEMDVKDIAALYTTDVIATCGYGVQANSFKDPHSDFRHHGEKIFHFNTRRSIEYGLLFFWPEAGRYLRMKLFSKESTKFLTDTLIEVMDEREKNQIMRNDLIDVLLTLRKGRREGQKDAVDYDDLMLVAQAAVFFTAGFEPTSSAIGFMLYELAKEPEVQQRLRREIKEFLRVNNGNITPENINDLTYLNMCCQEAFRMHPSLVYIDRECTPENGADFYSLEPILDFKIPRGFPIYIPTHAIHRDERFFPNPHKYDPERFSEENKTSIPPYAYIPFGLGQRDCMGKRFGILQVKLGIIYFLKNHYVEVSAKTEIDIVMHPLAMLATPKNGLYLRVRKDTGSDC